MRVLVAEDHPALAKSISQGLRDEGYAVDVSLHGSEALQLALNNPYDIIVLDLMLPGTDGWTILAHLRDSGRRIPVLCLTARDGVADRVKGLDLGADDYLVKPFAWEELLARVRAVMRRGHGHAATKLTVGDMEIDTAAKIVKRAGKMIDLTAREYGLLEYLAFRQGTVVSRTEIWEALYDQNDQNTSNVVDVYIGYLRNKIERDFPTKLIHTRRGQGYILAEGTPNANEP